MEVGVEVMVLQLPLLRGGLPSYLRVYLCQVCAFVFIYFFNENPNLSFLV